MTVVKNEIALEREADILRANRLSGMTVSPFRSRRMSQPGHLPGHEPLAEGAGVHV